MTRISMEQCPYCMSKDTDILGDDWDDCVNRLDLRCNACDREFSTAISYVPAGYSVFGEHGEELYNSDKEE